jgi:hypothetical protein
MAGFAMGLLAAVASADSLDGGQAMAYAKNPTGARALGMGGAQTAIADDAYLMSYNPAGMAQVRDMQFGSQTAFLTLGRQNNFLSLISPLEYRSPFKLGLSWTQYRLQDNLEVRTKNTPDPDGTAQVSSQIFQAATGFWTVPWLALGLDLKLVQDSIGDGNSSGFGADLGALAAFPSWKMGLALRDLYTGINWSSGSNELAPPKAVTGLSYGWKAVPVLASGEWEQSLVQGAKFRLGAEWQVMVRRFYLRAGWDNGALAGGIGLRWYFLQNFAAQMDYAAATAPMLGYDVSMLDHRFSLNLTYRLLPSENDPWKVPAGHPKAGS